MGAATQIKSGRKGPPVGSVASESNDAKKLLRNVTGNIKLEQCLSNLDMQMNHLGILLKYRVIQYV